ncbi:MAG: ATP-binding cassette domain-containing protein [Actinomycetota bacterium]|nr:ATP-binding cassette domain-containing protein [Actinomycetota bacterium]
MPPAVVSLRGVRVLCDGHPALDGFDLEVAAGERVALVGPSGAGKTTALRLCTGGVMPTSGLVSVLGQDLQEATSAELRRLRQRVGTVYQQLHLVGPLRVVHNVNGGRLGSWSRTRALASMIRPVDLGVARAALGRVGIADKLFERTDRLSGGEQQRVALARVLVQEPELILADEPVSSLDPARAEEVMDLLGEVVADGSRTLLVSLHDFTLARRRCDRVVGVRQGRVAFDLPAADVTDDLGTALYRIDA